MDDFDIAVEQQDHEITESGNVSPYTQHCLDEMAAGRPMPRLSNETLQRITASWRQSLTHSDEDEELYIDWIDE